MPYFGKYLSDDGAKNLPNYKYAGIDNSIIYKYVLKPWYIFLVNLLPRWLAPNIITLTGLACTGLTHGVVWYYCPNLEGPAPAWVWWACGIALFAYQTLDGMDGVQARRTGSGSPLGLLFDHGCDAINTTIISLTVIAALQLGPTWRAVFVHMLTCMGFFFQTWEEYYTGVLNLPVINGPDEGSLFMSCLFFATAFQNLEDMFWPRANEFMTGMLGFRFNNSDFIILLLFVTLSATVVQSVNATVIAVKEKKKEMGVKPFSVYEVQENLERIVAPLQVQSTDEQTWTYRVALTRYSVMVAIFAMFFFWMMFSPSNILERHPRLLMWTVGLIFFKLVTGLMVAHLCDEPYYPLGKTATVAGVLLCHSGLSWYMYVRNTTGVKNPEKVFSASTRVPSWLGAQEDTLLFELLTLTVASCSHFVVSIIHEVTSVLNIHCFFITPTPEVKENGGGNGNAKKKQ